ncbi:MAG: amidohydrolase [Leptospiraceae bacterium]|nr:amidohydrolase [Leptospiraceae bacterium]MCP5500774.1 amidohydrolase [Leptospiraceae bacterium]
MSYIQEERFQEIVSYRRHIHSFPELQYQEKETAAYVASHLKKLGFQFEEGLAGTGIACLLNSGKPGKTILVRADMDALPIQEENQVEYCSKKTGIMHACGHDGHTAILMGFATEIAKNYKDMIPQGKILLIFQPAEEGGCGADKMIEEGLLKKYKVDAAFALHVWNHIDIGKIGLVDGTMMASVDEFYIRVKGISGHGAMPQHTVDPVVVSSYIVTALQTLVSRNVDPLDSCVVTVGSIHAGDAFNVIPEVAEMKGTVRTFSKKLYDVIPEKFHRLVENTARALGAEVEIKYERVDKPTINTPEMANIVRRAARNILGEDSVTEEEARTMGGEDFSAFLLEVPGCYFFVGSRNPEKGLIHPHHSSFFDFDEEALKNGFLVMKEVVRIFLSEE